MDQVLSSKEIYESQVKKVREAGGLPKSNKTSYEEMKRFVEGGQYELTLDNTFQVGREMRVFDKILPLIFQRGWILIRAPEHTAASSPPTTHSASFGPTQSGAAASTLLDRGFGEQRYGSPSRHG
jgi:hypothetical protein